MKTKTISLLFLFFFGATLIAQESVSNETNELPSIEPVENKVIKIIEPPIPINDLFGRNLTLTGYMRGGASGNAIKVNTGYGYIEVGPKNTSWAHIYTDRPRFIFNKDVYTTTGGFSAYSDANLYLKTNGTTRMTIRKDNGFVGIGTSSPSRTLHVVGSIRFDVGSDRNLAFNDWDLAGAGGMTINAHNDANSSHKPLAFAASVFLFHGGPVRVDGKLVTKEMHVKTNVWSDFVFDDDYELITLEDLSKYIYKHRHLPGVPTEKEVKEKGINVAEINAILLQKVEELTLYLIEQDKKIKKLEKEVEQLKKN